VVKTLLPNITIGGTQGYNTNATIPVISGNMGAAFSACATLAAAVYPEPKAGNFYAAINSATATAMVFYDGSSWYACGKSAAQ